MLVPHTRTRTHTHTHTHTHTRARARARARGAKRENARSGLPASWALPGRLRAIHESFAAVGVCACAAMRYRDCDDDLGALDRGAGSTNPPFRASCQVQDRLCPSLTPCCSCCKAKPSLRVELARWVLQVGLRLHVAPMGGSNLRIARDHIRAPSACLRAQAS